MDLYFVVSELGRTQLRSVSVHVQTVRSFEISLKGRGGITVQKGATGGVGGIFTHSRHIDTSDMNIHIGWYEINNRIQRCTCKYK